MSGPALQSRGFQPVSGNQLGQEPAGGLGRRTSISTTRRMTVLASGKTARKAASHEPHLKLILDMGLGRGASGPGVGGKGSSSHCGEETGPAAPGDASVTHTGLPGAGCHGGASCSLQGRTVWDETEPGQVSRSRLPEEQVDTGPRGSGCCGRRWNRECSGAGIVRRVSGGCGGVYVGLCECVIVCQ